MNGSKKWMAHVPGCCGAGSNLSGCYRSGTYMQLNKDSCKRWQRFALAPWRYVRLSKWCYIWKDSDKFEGPRTLSQAWSSFSRSRISISQFTISPLQMQYFVCSTWAFAVLHTSKCPTFLVQEVALDTSMKIHLLAQGEHALLSTFNHPLLWRVSTVQPSPQNSCCFRSEKKPPVTHLSVGRRAR